MKCTQTGIGVPYADIAGYGEDITIVLLVGKKSYGNECKKNCV